jgi:Transglycosylase SLT domain
MMRGGLAALLLALTSLTLAAAAYAAPALEPVDHAICRLIERSARENALPVGFVTRIIWQESAFRAGAVSLAGAQGIAQFMPGTARERGLADPFDPEQAIPQAAALLADLRQQFGSLAVAAAAYNAGPARVESWLHGQAGLPAETRAYVRYVTARDVGSGDAEAWPGGEGEAAPADARSCVALTAVLRRERGGDDVGGAPLAPWGVQLAGNFSKALALASFERARRRYAAIIGDRQPMIIGRLLRSRGTRRFYQLRLPAASRAVADALCRRIEAVGGDCVALRS